MTQPYLPYGRQVIDDDDVAAVERVLRGDFLTTGPTVEIFERRLAKVTGGPLAAACANGSAALHLAARALELGKGDTVIVPAITFLATANGPALVGAEIIFADVDPDTGLMRPQDLEAAFARANGKRIKAVFPVHLAGQCEDLESISKIAAGHGTVVVEDACHALGTTWRGTPVGDCRFSAMSIFSFHPVKTIATGEGGAVTTNNEHLDRRVRLLRNHGMVRAPEEFTDGAAGFDDGEPNPWYYEMSEPGFNYRLSDIHAALGISQLDKLTSFASQRRDLVAAYDERMGSLPPCIRPLVRTPDCEPVCHLYVALIDFADAGISRGALMRALRDRGIGTQVHYVPVPHQPYYRARDQHGEYPGAVRYYQRCLSLPLFPSMTSGDVDRVCDALKELLA